ATALRRGGRAPPRAGRGATTPEAAAETSPGGRDARRYEDWISVGLQVRAADPDAVTRVEDAAQAAGNLGRLSRADVSLAALALELEGHLITDDYTLLDVAKRLAIATRTVNPQRIDGTLDFEPR